MSLQPVWTMQTRASAHACDFKRRWKPAAMFLTMLEAASDHAAHLGFDFDAMQARRVSWVLSRFRIHFHAFPAMNEPVVLQTWPCGLQQRLFFTRDFLLTGAGGQLLASATSAWVLIDPVARRMLPPQALQMSLPGNEGRRALDMTLEKINPPVELPERLQIEAGYSAVDVLAHANSARYVEWLCDALGVEAFERGNFAWLQINFIRETRPGERLSLRVGQNGAGAADWVVEGFNLSAGTRGFEAAFEWREDPPASRP
jgi:medium-chain acyl-[acyl-carrier-protein] hydrolase